MGLADRDSIKHLRELMIGLARNTSTSIEYWMNLTLIDLSEWAEAVINTIPGGEVH